VDEPDLLSEVEALRMSLGAALLECAEEPLRLVLLPEEPDLDEPPTEDEPNLDDPPIEDEPALEDETLEPLLELLVLLADEPE